MGFFTNFAIGAMKGMQDVAQEKKAAEVARIEAAAKEREYNLDLARYNFDVDKFNVEQQNYFGETFVNLAKEGFDPNSQFMKGLASKAGLGDLGKVAILMDEEANTQSFGDFKLNLSGEVDYKNMSAFDRSQIFWDSWQAQMSTPEGFEAAKQYFELNPEARAQLEDAVKKNEYELRLGNIGRQKAKGIEIDGLQFINLPERYSNATRLFDELGFGNVSEDAYKDIAAQLEDFDPETEVAVMMNTRDSGGAEQPYPVAVDRNTYALWSEMASNAGYKGVQDMLFDFSYETGSRKEGETNAQFALRQNSLLTKAATLYGDGFADFLANPANMNKETAQTYLDKLQAIMPKDREGQIQVMSMLVKTPANVFTKTRDNRYAGNSSQRVKPVMTGLQFIEQTTGMKAGDFNEGFKAQEEAVEYLNQLEALEASLGEQVGTGWVRDGMRFATAFGIQIQQGVTSFKQLMDSNSDFSQVDGDTTQADLQAVVKKVYGDDFPLAEISEADALRLTLAAKMARAVDPSGRLSNQDFEIQLRRLGQRAFSTPQEIAASIALVRREFEADLQYKTRLKAVMDNQAALTPQTARTIQAALTMKNLERVVYGAKGFETVTGPVVTDEVVDEGEGGKDDKPAAKNIRPSSIVPGLFVDDSGSWYRDQEGTQPIPTGEISKILKQRRK